MHNNPISILVLGGGYAGVMAALRVAGRTRKQSVRVTLVNRSADFVERPRLPEVAVGKHLPQKSLTAMLRGSSADFLQATVTQINPERRQVVVETAAGKRDLAYDYLIIALGSRVNRQQVPGVVEYAYTPDPHGAFAIEPLAAQLAVSQRVAVIGGGATGIELATEIRSAYPEMAITLITQGTVGRFKGSRVQRHIAQALDEQSIERLEQSRVTRLTAGCIHTEQTKSAADLIIWAGGFCAPPLARAAGIQVNAHNQVAVDPYLRSLSHPNIFAAGDAAHPVESCGTPIRMALLPALVMGATAAENVSKTIKQRPLKPLSFVWYGQAVTLGWHDAVGFNTFPADRAVGPILRRTVALRIRNFFVWFLGAVLEWERRWTGAFYWNGQGRYRRISRTWQKSYD